MTVGGEGFRYDLWPIVGGPSLGSRFAQVLDEIDMADRVELLTLEKSIALMYPSQDSDCRSFIGSAVPQGEDSLGPLELMNLAEVFCEAVERYGGRVLLGARVERIREENGAVTGVDTAQGSFDAPIVGQCGRHKPRAAAPLRGLFYVGCDAGGYGCGTHQAADSGVNVADLLCREHRALARGS